MAAVFATEGCFGAGFTGYPVLFGIQLSLPLLWFFDGFFHSVTIVMYPLMSELVFGT
jgi:hypothetical protein